MNSLKRLRIAALAFAYGMSAVSPAMADDSEIYIGGVSSGNSGGQPNVLMLLDTSGSMLFPMYDKYPTGHPQAGSTVSTAGCKDSINQTLDCAASEDDRRSRHLLNAVKRILENMDGNIRVGIARYNSDSSGGRVIYPVKSLSARASTAATEDRTYNLSVSAADAHQSGSNGSNIDLSSSTLLLGDTPVQTSTLTSTSSNQVHVTGSNTPSTNYYGDQSVLPLGAYFYYRNNAKTSYYNSATSIGLKYNVSIPQGAEIVSAELVMTRNTGRIVGLSTTDCGTSRGCYPNADSSGSFAVALDFQNAVSPGDYGSGNNRVDGSNRSYSGGVLSTTVNIGASELTASNTSKTVDVKNQIQAMVNNSGWSTSSYLALRLRGTNNDLASPIGLPLLGGILVTSGRAIGVPSLKIVWNESSDAMYTGVQFSGVDIPRGATINSASLQFTASQAATGTAQFEIKTDPSAIPEAFSSIQHLDATRWNGGSTTTWNPGNWTNGTTYSANVASILQAHVNQSSFCGGLGVAFRLRQTGVYSPSNTNTRRYASSYDGNAAKAPRLVVNYTLPDEDADTCLRASRTVSVRSGTDDGEIYSGTEKLNSAAAALRSQTDVGLRFANLTVPQGATIRTVTLKLKASNTPSAANRGNFTVKGAKLANVDTFSSSNTIASLLTNATSASQSFPVSAWTSGTSYEFISSHTGSGKASSNLVGAIQEIVDQSTWSPGNGMALLLKGDRSNTSSCGTSYPCFHQADVGSASAAALVVTYESNDRNDGYKTVRQDLMELMDTMVGAYYGGGTPMGESAYEAALYMKGGAPFYGKGSSYTDSRPAQNAAYTQYLSPVDGGTCQSNNIIMLTDGAPSNDADNKSTGGTCSGSWDCMKKTAANLKATGFTHGSPTLQSYVSTYTIGFGPEVANTTSDAYKGLAAVAASGGGDFFPASDVDSLVASFETIFARLTDSNGTMASPGVAVNQLNRTQHLDQLYYGVFKPQTSKRWPGNLKRYRLKVDDTGATVVDIEDRAAISTSTKYFDANAKSWWSSTVDGNEADKGGAASKQTSALKVYTDNPANNVLSELNQASPPTGMAADDVQWIRGYDVDNDNAQGPNGFRQAMGAPMHAQPVMLVAPNNTDYTVYVGTNDGLLHAIDSATGSHRWAWLPSDLQGNVTGLRSNNPMGNGGLPIYGLDGNWTMIGVSGESSKRLLIGGMRQGGSNYYALKVDRNYTLAPQLTWVIRPNTRSEFNRLGRTWSQPQFTYVRLNGTDGSGNATTTVTPVMVFGGGLDFAKYEGGSATPAGTGGDLGNAVYMVNAQTGELIWWASSSATATNSSANNVTALKYSVPGSVRVVDKNGDGYADHLYFGDVGGQIFRVDIDNTKAAPKLVKRVALLAQLGNAETVGKANDRRFYEAPAVEYALDSVKELYAAVAIGSGDRNFPKSNRTTAERFYVIRDYDAARFDIVANYDAAKPTAAYMDEAGKGYNGTPDLATYAAAFNNGNLADLSSTFGASATTAADAKKGWRLNMPTTGEKVLSSPFIFSQKQSNGTQQYRISFNSFAPDSIAASGCSPISGSTNVWNVLLSNAAPSNAQNSGTASDRYVEGVASGITGSGVPMILKPDGDDDGSDPDPDDPPPPGCNAKLVDLSGTSGTVVGDAPCGLGVMQRTRWFDRRTSE